MNKDAPQERHQLQSKLDAKTTGFRPKSAAYLEFFSVCEKDGYSEKIIGNRRFIYYRVFYPGKGKPAILSRRSYCHSIDI